MNVMITISLEHWNLTYMQLQQQFHYGMLDIDSECITKKSVQNRIQSQCTDTHCSEKKLTSLVDRLIVIKYETIQAVIEVKIDDTIYGQLVQPAMFAISDYASFKIQTLVSVHKTFIDVSIAISIGSQWSRPQHSDHVTIDIKIKSSTKHRQKIQTLTIHIWIQ